MVVGPVSVPNVSVGQLELVEWGSTGTAESSWPGSSGLQSAACISLHVYHVVTHNW